MTTTLASPAIDCVSGSTREMLRTPSFLATRLASAWWPGAYIATEFARWPEPCEALLTVPSLNPSASTRSPTCAASPGIEVPFSTATVILLGDTAAAELVVVVVLEFFAAVDGLLLSFDPLTSAGTPTAAAAPRTSTPA